MNSFQTATSFEPLHIRIWCNNPTPIAVFIFDPFQADQTFNDLGVPVIPGNQDYYFFFNVSRKFGHAMANVVIPLYFLSFCACLSFLIPATCGERLGFVITIQLAVTFATQMIEQEAAPSGDFPQPVIFGFVQYVIGKECIL